MADAGTVSGDNLDGPDRPLRSRRTHSRRHDAVWIRFRERKPHRAIERITKHPMEGNEKERVMMKKMFAGFAIAMALTAAPAAAQDSCCADRADHADKLAAAAPASPAMKKAVATEDARADGDVARAVAKKLKEDFAARSAAGARRISLNDVKCPTCDKLEVIAATKDCGVDDCDDCEDCAGCSDMTCAAKA